MIVDCAVIQYQDYSGEWQNSDMINSANQTEVMFAMQQAQKRFSRYRIRCIDRDSGRLVDIL